MEHKKFNYSNLDDKTKGMVKMGIILLVVTITLLLTSFLYNLFVGNTLSFEQIENQMIRGTKKYIESHPEKKGELDYSTIKINVTELVNGGYMKELSEYTDKNTSCNGEIIIHKNNENYSYTPKLDCGDKYKYKTLVDEITKNENIVSSDAGLYKIETDEPYYLYRGEDVRNYVKIEDKLWRILRINSDNTIRIIEDYSKNRIIWDDRYNSEKKIKYGINEFEYIEPSRIKEELIESFNNDEIVEPNLKSLVIPQELCIGKKAKNDFDNTGSVECSKRSELMNAGTIYLSEYFQASLDENCFSIESDSCVNYNYMAKFQRKLSTLTASNENTYEVYSIYKIPEINKATYSSYLHLVLNLSKDINYSSGDGSIDNPYIINITA